jgi:hypothetical protein
MNVLVYVSISLLSSLLCTEYEKKCPSSHFSAVCFSFLVGKFRYFLLLSGWGFGIPMSGGWRGAKDILASRVAMGVTSLTIDDLNRPFYSCQNDGTLHLTFSLL